MSEHIHFVTGRLAEHALRQVVEPLANKVGFTATIEVLPITVAALMTPAWIARHWRVPPDVSRVIIPGYCSGDLAPLIESAGVTVERGPRDLRALPEMFGQLRRPAEDYGAYDIEIIAEINHAPRWELSALLAEAERLRADGADLIDVGCNPGEIWTGVAGTVRALRDAGHRVSIDSLQPEEIGPAVAAGAELVLSVNSSNRAVAVDWLATNPNLEVVVLPDQPSNLEGLDETVEYLAARGVRLRIDPVLEPIGFGFAASLGRYLEVRRRYPDAEMMMGIGNLTELTDADSAAINVLLLGFCQEQAIRSVLTTQVIPWARTAVRECDLARRLVHHAVTQRSLPKHVEPRLVLLRDPKTFRYGQEALDRLAAEIKDHNYRIFAEDGALHVVTVNRHWSDTDPFALLQRMLTDSPKPLDPAHAFYLGYELCKATTALTLGKDYRQDEALDWGFLTRPEVSHRGKS